MDRHSRIERFGVRDLPSIGTMEVPLGSPLTVLCGANGAGKTTLLRAMWAALDPVAANETIKGNGKYTSGSALVELLIDGQNEVAEVNFSRDGAAPVGQTTAHVYHIDSAALTPAHQKTLCDFNSVEDIVNGAGPRELDAQTLAEVSYIVHRQYRTVTLYEIELDGILPFFEVSYGNGRYDSRTMGAGELASLYLWWSISRCEDNSILLVEEPEAFLSFGNQRSLFNFLVSSTVRKGLATVISSHSAAFISPLPKESLVFLTRTHSGVDPILNRPPVVLLRDLGIEPRVDKIVYVEDSIGRIFCKAILERRDPLFARQVYIDQRNGDSEVTSALRPHKGAAGPISFIGVYDGDMRGKTSQDLASISVFLPGEQPLEVIFRQMVDNHTEKLRDQTGKQDCEAIIRSLEGKDHHDWYEELSRELGLSRDQLFQILFSIWIAEPENESEADKTAELIIAAATKRQEQTG